MSLCPQGSKECPPTSLRGLPMWCPSQGESAGVGAGQLCRGKPDKPYPGHDQGQHLQWNITSVACPPDTVWWKWPRWSSPNPQPSLIMRRTSHRRQHRRGGGAAYKIPALGSSKPSRSPKTREVQEMVTAKKSLRRQLKAVCPGWDPGIEKGHLGRPKETWIKYGLPSIIMSLYWFVHCDAHAPLLQNVNNRTGGWVYEKSVSCTIFP